MSSEERRSLAFLNCPTGGRLAEQDLGIAEEEIGQRYVGDGRCWTLPWVSPTGTLLVLFVCGLV